MNEKAVVLDDDTQDTLVFVFFFTVRVFHNDLNVSHQVPPI